MHKAIIEGIATCFLMLTIVLAQGPMAPLVVGFMMIGLMYTGAWISGAHYNPAVSLAMLMQDRITRDEFPLYVVAQLIGAAAGSAVGVFLMTVRKAEIDLHTNHTLGALSAEFLGTFILVLVFLNVTLPDREKGNGYYGVAVGLVIVALIAVLGDISGAVFNPALAVGMALIGKIGWGDVWLYLVSTFLGAAAAATVYSLLVERTRL